MEDKNKTPIRALLFDLGGVIIDIDFNHIFTSWAKDSHCSAEEIKARFTFNQFYEAHERGEIDEKEYFASLRKTLDINLTDDQFDKGWNSIYNGEVPGIFEMLQGVRGTLPLYAFTNSNHAHKRVWSRRFEKVLSLFETVFNSSDIGKRKPEPDSFQYIADEIGISMHEIVFYDDLLENIEGARRSGLETVHVKTIKDIETSLKNMRFNNKPVLAD